MKALTTNAAASRHPSTRQERKAAAREQKLEAKALETERQALLAEVAAARKEVVADLFEPWVDAARTGKSLDASDLSELVELWRRLDPNERRNLEVQIRTAMQEGGRDDVKSLRAWRNATGEHVLKLLSGGQVPMKKSDLEAGLAAIDEQLTALSAERARLEAGGPEQHVKLEAVSGQLAALGHERSELAAFKDDLEKLPKTGPFQDTRFNFELGINLGLMLEGGATIGIDVQPPPPASLGGADDGEQPKGRTVEPFVTARLKAVVPTVKGVLGTKHHGVETGLSVPIVKVTKNNPIQGDVARFSPVFGSVAASSTGLLGAAVDLPVPLLPLPAFLAFPVARMGLSVMVSDPRLSKVSDKAAKLITKINHGMSKVGHAVGDGVKKLIPGKSKASGEEMRSREPAPAGVAAARYFAIAQEHAAEYAQMRDGAWQQLPGFEGTHGPTERTAAWARRIDELTTAELRYDPDRKTGGTSFKTAVEFETPSQGAERSSFKYDLEAFARQQAQTRVALAIDEPVTPIVRRHLELEGKTYDGWMKANVPGDGRLAIDPKTWTRSQTREVLVQAVFSELLGNYDTKRDQWTSTGGHAIDNDLDLATTNLGHVDEKLTRHTVQTFTPPVANLLYRDYVHGKVELDDSDFGAMFDTVARLQALPEAQYRALLADAVSDPAALEKLVESRDGLHLKVAGLVEDLKAEKTARDDGTLGLFSRSKLGAKDAKLVTLSHFAETETMEHIMAYAQTRAGSQKPPQALEG